MRLQPQERAKPFGILLKALLHEGGHFAGLASREFKLNAAMAGIDRKGIGQRLGVLGILPPSHGSIRLGLHKLIPFGGKTIEWLDRTGAWHGRSRHNDARI